MAKDGLRTLNALGGLAQRGRRWSSLAEHRAVLRLRAHYQLVVRGTERMKLQEIWIKLVGATGYAFGCAGVSGARFGAGVSSVGSIASCRDGALNQVLDVYCWCKSHSLAGIALGNTGSAILREEVPQASDLCPTREVSSRCGVFF